MDSRVGVWALDRSTMFEMKIGREGSWVSDLGWYELVELLYDLEFGVSGGVKARPDINVAVGGLH